MERILAVVGLVLALVAIYVIGLSSHPSVGGVVTLTLWTGVIVAIGVGLWKKEG